MIKRHLIFNFILTISLFMTSNDVKSQEKDSTINQKIYKNSIELSPISPIMQIYAIQYSHKILQRGEMLFGLAYMNIQYDMGNTNAPAIILGYRQYIWSKLHIEYQIWPTYDNFYEKNDKKYYKSFDIWNEFRIGYQFDFTIYEAPFFVSAQWPFGFALYAGNKPQSFKDYEKKRDNRFFYKAILVFIGIRF